MIEWHWIDENDIPDWGYCCWPKDSIKLGDVCVAGTDANNFDIFDGAVVDCCWLNRFWANSLATGTLVGTIGVGNCCCELCSAVVVVVSIVPVAVFTEDVVNVIWLTPDVSISSIDVGGGTLTTDVTLVAGNVTPCGIFTFPVGNCPTETLFAGIW